MKFKLIEEFKDKDFRDRHYDQHVLGKYNMLGTDLLFDVYDYPDDEEGREQYERDADNLARMWQSAGLSGRFSWMPALKPGDVVGYEGKVSVYDNSTEETCYVLFQPETLSYGKLVVFIPNSSLAPRTGNLIKTFYKIRTIKYLDMIKNNGYVNELPQNIEKFNEYQNLSDEEKLEKQTSVRTEKEKIKEKKKQDYIKKRKKH